MTAYYSEIQRKKIMKFGYYYYDEKKNKTDEKFKDNKRKIS